MVKPPVVYYCPFQGSTAETEGEIRPVKHGQAPGSLLLTIPRQYCRN